MFKLAIEEEQLDLLEAQTREVLAIFRSNLELNKILMHPKVSREEKIHLIEQLFRSHVSEHMTGFLVIILEKGRYEELEAIFEYFLSQVKEYKNIGVAYVSSAVSLSAKQRQQIEQRLLDTTKYVRFEMHYTEEPELIGGMVIRIGDRVVDSSIRTQLNTMANELKKIQLT
ncbi:MAG: F-type H+-transporting ATPase subunit delta [Clostridiales bacterium]|nr:F-type H+-transporting ATPase subunit delta [Clostridiales bacterium]